MVPYGTPSTTSRQPTRKKLARYERLTRDLRENGINAFNFHFEIGCRGVLNARNSLPGVGDPLQHLESSNSSKAARRPWPHCSCKAQPRVEWGQPHGSGMDTKTQLVWLENEIFTQSTKCIIVNFFCSRNTSLGAKNPLGNIQLFGLMWGMLRLLALLGLILPMKVYSIVSCFFLYCFEFIEIHPPSTLMYFDVTKNWRCTSLSEFQGR